MPIVKMSRFTLAGLLSEREGVLLALQRLGAVQIEDASTQLDAWVAVDDDSTSPPSVAGSRIEVQTAEGCTARLASLIANTVRALPKKKSLFTIRRKVRKSVFEEAASREREIWDVVEQLEKSFSRISHLRGQRTRLTAAIDVLEPWRDIPFDLSEDGTDRVRVWVGSMPAGERFDGFRSELAARHAESHVVVLPPFSGASPSSKVEEPVRFLVAVMREEEEDVRSLLKSHAFLQIPAHGEQGTPAEVIARLQAEFAGIETELDESEAACMAMGTASLVDFEILHDLWFMKLEHANANTRLGETGSTFVISGWVPEGLSQKVEQGLHSRFTVAIATRPPMPGEDFPVLLKNHPLVRPYEVITEMFSTPSTGEIDPNPLLAPFFFVLFGLMLGDAGYGLLLAAGSAALVWGVGVQGNMRRMCLLFIQGSLAGIVSGLMFGSFFGDIVTVTSQNRISFPTLWFNPLTDPIRMLAFSMILGVLHILTGMCAKAYVLILKGKIVDAVLDVGSWFALFLGFGLLAVGGIVGKIGTGLVLVAVLSIIWFSARDSKRPAIRIFKGIYNLYGITGYFGDVLSYSRIMALGLAGGVIAMVINKMGSIGGFGFFGIVVFIVVAVFGHALNLALSTLGAYVHTSRLQYVEFFGKFYEGGGQAWAPLRSRTKYTEIVSND